MEQSMKHPTNNIMRNIQIKKSLLFLLVLCTFQANGQNTENTEKKATQYIAINTEKPKMTLFQGFSLGIDILNPILYTLGDYGHAEAQLRLNLRNTWLPTFEIGYGKCDKTDANTSIHYKTNAPFLRLGIDYNLLKNKWQDNRLTAGLRYGFCTYNYDMSGPAINDPIWGGSSAFNYNNIHTTSGWIEIVISAQAKLIRNIHMGWSLRYKQELSTTKSIYSKPYYIPGYGTTTSSSAWGMTYSLFFDLNWGKNKKKKISITSTPNGIAPLQTDTTTVVDDPKQSDSIKLKSAQKAMPSPQSKAKPIKAL